MIAGLLAWLGAGRWVRAALLCGLVIAAFLLFLLSARRSGERLGRLLERLEPKCRVLGIGVSSVKQK